MFTNRTSAHRNSHPLRTLVGMIGIILGIVFFLQAAGTFSFDMTNPLYLKIFAVYAILSGIVLVINIERHGVLRY